MTPDELAAAYAAVEADMRARLGEHVDVKLRRGHVVIDARELVERSTLLAAVNALGKMP